MLRSFLYAPGINEKLIGKVFTAGADAAVLDLEDSVPAGRKAEARELVAGAIRAHAGTGGPGASAHGGSAAEVHVRINRVGTDLAASDIAAVVGHGLACLRLPKVESAEEVREADRLVTEAEASSGVADGSTRITCLIESVAGLLSALEIASSSSRVTALAFGASDFVADAGIDPSADEQELLLAKSHLVLASRAAGIDPPIASVHTSLNDDAGLLSTSEGARRLGFFGRSAIHPRQIETIHSVFTPSPEVLARARDVVTGLANAEKQGDGALRMPDGQFVDLAVAKRAMAVLDFAELLGLGGDNSEPSR